jgi:hypothetical protein
VKRLAFLFLPVVAACSSGAVAPTPAPSGVPLTATCAADGGACLFGAATAVGFAVSSSLSVNLYRVFPSGSLDLVRQELVASQPVAADGTWAFSGREAWGHYYVQLVATFQAPPGTVPNQATTLVGPLVAPSTQAQALQIGPIFASVVESSGGDGGGQQIDQISARVFDPLTGNEVSDAAVSIVLGDASVSLGWDTDADIPAYGATFGPGTLGQATYTVTASSWDGAAQLVAPDPAPTGAITSPAAGAAVSIANGAFAIDWMPEPAADYEVVEVFEQTDGGWAPAYVSPSAIPPDVSNTGPLASAGVSLDAGTYLVNVAYVRANCVTTGAGCVQSGSIATETFTLNP